MWITTLSASEQPNPIGHRYLNHGLSQVTAGLFLWDGKLKKNPGAAVVMSEDADSTTRWVGSTDKDGKVTNNGINSHFHPTFDPCDQNKC